MAITGTVSNTIKKSAKRVGAANNFLRKRTPGVGNRDVSSGKGLCVDPFADQLPPLVADIVGYLSQTGFSQSDCQLARTLTRDLTGSIIQSYEKEKQVPWNTYNPSTALAALAYFLAHLPYPLLTRQLQECFLMCIQTTKPEEGANDAAIRKEIRNFTPDIPAIRSAIEMLPSGHRLTLASISQLFHQVCNDSTNNTQPSHIAKCLSHEVYTSGEESTLGKVRSEEQLKANCLVEAFIENYPTLFGDNGRENKTSNGSTGTNSLRSMSVGARRQFDERLRSSVLLLKEDLQKSLSDIAAESTITEEQKEICSAYMEPTLTEGKLVCRTLISSKEWTMLGGFFAASFLPFLVTGSWWSVFFVIMIAVIICMNLPMSEVVEMEDNGILTTHEAPAMVKPPQSYVYSAELLDCFSLQEHEKKKGSYRILMHFENGVQVPMTNSFCFSPEGKAQRELLNILCRFTGKSFDEEKND